MSLPLKEFWKLVNIWGSYGQEFCVLFFLRHSVQPAHSVVHNDTDIWLNSNCRYRPGIVTGSVVIGGERVDPMPVITRRETWQLEHRRTTHIYTHTDRQTPGHRCTYISCIPLGQLSHTHTHHVTTTLLTQPYFRPTTNNNSTELDTVTLSDWVTRQTFCTKRCPENHLKIQ